MRLAVTAGRAQIVRDGIAFDIEAASDGAFGPSMPTVFEDWAPFRDWAATAVLNGGSPFDAAEADAPSPQPRQVFGIGLNYRAHQIESGFPEPAEPLVFTKFPSSIAGPTGTVNLFTDQVDWEAEVAVVIGSRAYQVAEADAWSYVAGITASQDFSARDVQMRPAGSPQFSLGKSYPGFTSLGPVLVTLDELEDPDDIPLSCVINGRVVQSSSTRDLIFSVPTLIAYVSAVLPLLPGDVILTGTPSGVGMGMTPPTYLQPGDTVRTHVADLQLEHTAIARPTVTEGLS